MDLGEIAHLPKPITLHVNFSSFVFNILLLDFSFPRWSVNLAFLTSFFTALLRAGARRPCSPQWFFYNICCYSSTKFSNLSCLHQRQVLSWNSFLFCSPIFPPAAVPNPLVTTSKAPGVRWIRHFGGETSLHRCGGEGCFWRSTGQEPSPTWTLWTIWWPHGAECSVSWWGASQQRPLAVNFREWLVQSPHFSEEEAEI